MADMKVAHQEGGQSADTPIITFPLRTLQVNTPSASSPKDDPPISRPASEAGLPDVAGSKGASEAGTAPDVDVEAGCALVYSPKKELFKGSEGSELEGSAEDSEDLRKSLRRRKPPPEPPKLVAGTEPEEQPVLLFTFIAQLLALGVGAAVCALIWTQLWNYSSFSFSTDIWASTNQCYMSATSVNLCAITFLVILYGFAVSLFILIALRYRARRLPWLTLTQFIITGLAAGAWIGVAAAETVLGNQMEQNYDGLPPQAYDTRNVRLITRVLSYVVACVYLYQISLDILAVCVLWHKFRYGEDEVDVDEEQGLLKKEVTTTRSPVEEEPPEDEDEPPLEGDPESLDTKGAKQKKKKKKPKHKAGEGKTAKTAGFIVDEATEEAKGFAVDSIWGTLWSGAIGFSLPSCLGGG